jgi:hypothetical protein
MDWLVLVMLPAIGYVMLTEETENKIKEIAHGMKESVLDMADLFLYGGIK